MTSFGTVARRASFIIVLAIALVTCLARSASAESADIVLGFSASNNPNGVWSYYYTPSGGSATLFTQNANPVYYNNNTPPLDLLLPGWSTNSAVPGFQYIVQNTTGSTVYPYQSGYPSTVTVPNNTLWMDPENGSVSVVFTAPTAGTYAIDGDFLGIDSGENSHPVQILDDGTVVWSGTISSFGQDDPFGLLESLNTGDTIAFDVLTGSSGCTYCNLSTGLDGTVTLTPEPASILLFGTGLLAIGFILRKRFVV